MNEREKAMELVELASTLPPGRAWEQNRETLLNAIVEALILARDQTLDEIAELVYKDWDGFHSPYGYCTEDELSVIIRAFKSKK